jgi:hypothetical protein
MCAADWARVTPAVRKAFNKERERLVESGAKKLSPLARAIIDEALRDVLKVREALGLPTKAPSTEPEPAMGLSAGPAPADATGADLSKLTAQKIADDLVHG